MRDVSPDVASILTGSREVFVSASVLYDGESTFDDIPIADGSLGSDVSNEIQTSVEVSLPRFAPDADDRTVDLLPGSPESPLGCDGQRLALTYRVGLPGDVAEAIGMGVYRISDWEEGEGTIDITARSLEAVIQEARFLNPVATAANATYPAAFTALLEDLLPVDIMATSAGVTGRQTFEDDRLAALGLLVDAWPARMFVDDLGVLVVGPPHDDAADPIVSTLTDGVGGTVVQSPDGGAREGTYNAVKASGEATGDTLPVSAVAYLTDGPRRWNGPYGNVPYFYESPLLTTVPQCRAAARTRLANLQRVAEQVTITAAPDPRYVVGDLIELNYRGRSRAVRIDGISLPLMATGGTMTITGHVAREVA